MFEVAELGQKLDRSTYHEKCPFLRESLLDAQLRLREADFSTVIVVAGAEGAGKGEVVNLLLNWLDARGIDTHAMGLPTSEEVNRPDFYRFWRRLPPRGNMGIFFGSWYTNPIVKHIFGELDDFELDRQLNRIVEFERMLVEEKTLLLKFWLHIDKRSQSKRLKKLSSNPLTAWRVTENDWRFRETYDQFVESASRVLRRTSTGVAPWDVVESHDERFRNVTVAERLLQALEERLEQPPRESPQPSPPEPQAVNIISSLDLDQKLDRDQYEAKLEKYQAQLGELSREMESKSLSAVMVFEGSDAAGKGGAIRRVVHALDARYYRVIPVAAPTDEEAARPYLWRFWRYLPRAGHFTVFDRSWYGRVLVERIEGFCHPSDWRRAFREINAFEEQMSEAGIVVIKFWVAISKDEQFKRFKHREETGYKRYKLTEEDWRNRDKWEAYETAASEMIQRTSTEIAPWKTVEANDKKFARIKVLKTVCKRLKSALRDAKKSKKK